MRGSGRHHRRASAPPSRRIPHPLLLATHRIAERVHAARGGDWSPSTAPPLPVERLPAERAAHGRWSPWPPSCPRGGAAAASRPPPAGFFGGLPPPLALS